MSRAKAACHDRFPLIAALLAVSVQAAGCTGEGADPAAESPADAGVAPPVARVIPEQLETHGHTRVDNYYWLNQRDNPEVISYLEAENGYTDALMAHTEDLQTELFEEIKGRIQQTDLSVPVREGRLLLLHAHRRGAGLPDPCPEARLAGRGGGSHPRRQPARRGPRLLRRFPRGQLQRRPDGVGRGHPRAPHLHHPDPEPRHRRGLPGVDRRRVRQHGVGRGQPDALLRAARSRHAAFVPDLPAPDRHGPCGRRARVPGGRRGVQQRHPQDEVEAIPRHLLLPHPDGRAPLPRRDEPRGRLHPLPSARARTRAPLRPLRGPLLRPDQPRRGRELQAYAHPRRRDGDGQLGDGHPAPGRRLPAGVRAVPELPRPLGARGRAHPPARPRVGGGRAPDRVRRAGLPGLAVGQPRTGHEHPPLRVHVALGAALGLRLRHVHPRAHAAQGGRSARRL